MKDLNFELKRLCRRNRDGSYATQTARQRILTQVATQLHQMGFPNMHVQSLKPKHVEALVKGWMAAGLSTGRIKNCMAHLRWWAEKIGKTAALAGDNAHYGIGRREYVTNVSKARELTSGDLARITCPYTRLSLMLQAAFGLRREESIKIIVAWADRGHALTLRAAWTKGGREREISIRTEEQRRLLDEIKRFVGNGSLIPPEKTYVQQLKRYEEQCKKAGIHKAHGHRHQYAQRRYKDLTGQLSPAAGGKTSKELTPEEKAADTAARSLISHELGHEREQITAVYLGR